MSDAYSITLKAGSSAGKSLKKAFTSNGLLLVMNTNDSFGYMAMKRMNVAAYSFQMLDRVSRISTNYGWNLTASCVRFRYLYVDVSGKHFVLLIWKNNYYILNAECVGLGLGKEQPDHTKAGDCSTWSFQRCMPCLGLLGNSFITQPRAPLAR